MILSVMQTDSSIPRLALILFTFLLLFSCSPSSYKGYLKTDKAKIVDQKGEEFKIRGINLGNWLLPEGYMWYIFGEDADRPRRIEKKIADLIGEEKAANFWKQYRENYITKEDIKLISQLGFNTLRLPLNGRLFIQNNENLQYVDRVIRWCKQEGIYIVLDLHGAPGGQTGRNIDDSQRDIPELFIENLYRQETIELWKTIARRYKNETTVLAYDLLNEPLPADTGSQYNDQLEPLYKEITEAIRKIDRRHIITIEGANWANDWSVFNKPFDDNLLYQFHKYWDEPTEKTIQRYKNFRILYNVPIWCGETGENTNKWYKEAYFMLEENQIGWAFWPWKKLGKSNNPVSQPIPYRWHKMHNYMNKGTPIEQEEAILILESYLDSLKLENCTINTEVLDALPLK